MSETTESGTSDKFKIGISIWLSFCLFACLWFLSRFMTGRKQLKNNLHVIEDGLKRMQEEIEKRQREENLSCSDNLEELMEELLKKDSEETTEEQKEKEANPGGEDKRANEEAGDSEEAELLVQDKKND